LLQRFDQALRVMAALPTADHQLQGAPGIAGAIKVIN
jgi:hypothetical protein